MDELWYFYCFKKILICLQSNFIPISTFIHNLFFKRNCFAVWNYTIALFNQCLWYPTNVEFRGLFIHLKKQNLKTNIKEAANGDFLKIKEADYTAIS